MRSVTNCNSVQKYHILATVAENIIFSSSLLHCCHCPCHHLYLAVQANRKYLILAMAKINLPSIVFVWTPVIGSTKFCE